MFIGEYYHSLDSKARLRIPAKLRDGLGDEFVMTKGLDNCLFIYPMEEWKLVEEKLNRLPLSSRGSRAFVRLFFSGASSCSLDKQGRVLIPSNLREHARLDRELLIIGVSTRLELWSLDEWESYNSTQGLSYEDMAEKMVDLGI